MEITTVNMENSMIDISPIQCFLHAKFVSVRI